MNKIVEMAQCALAAYEEDNLTGARKTYLDLKYKHLLFLSGKSTQVYLHKNQDGDLILSFRGTDIKKPEDVIADAAIKLHEYQVGSIHTGFYHALSEVYVPLLAAIKHRYEVGKKIFITGHSLGGALATIMAGRLMMEEGYRDIELYTFGQPRVGTKEFVDRIDELLGDKYIRVVNDCDVVPRIPPVTKLNYAHSKKFYFIDSAGQVSIKRGEEILSANVANVIENVAKSKETNWLKKIKEGIFNSAKDSFGDHSMELYFNKLSEFYGGGKNE